MIRLRHELLAVLLLLASLPFGCAGTETGNPPATDSTVEVDVFPPGASFSPPPEVDATVIERASELGVSYLSLGHVELIPAGSCDPLLGDEGAFVAGAVALERPGDGQFSAPAGSYCALRLWPTVAADDPRVPSLLRGHTFVVRFVDGEGRTYVVVLSDRTEPIVLYAAGGAFTLGAETVVTLLVDAAGALVATEFWTRPAEADGSWLLEEEGDAAYLRTFEATPELFRLFLGAATGVGDADAGVAGGAGGGTAADAGAPAALGAQIASSGTP